MDMAVGLQDEQRFSVLLGNGNGTFRAAQTFVASPAVGDLTYSVATGDFNGDGYADIAVGSDLAALHVSFGNGDGTFKATTSYAISGVNNEVRHIEVGDVNHDGIADVVGALRNGINGRFAVWLGNADGSFKLGVTYLTITSAATVALSDFNGDGILDVATSGYSIKEFAVSLGNGDGTFAAMRSFTNSATDRPYMVKAADFNGDGAPDLFLANPVDAFVSVFMQETEQVFTMPRLDLLSRENALGAMSTIDATAQRVNAQLALIGASQARIDAEARVLSSRVLEYEAAASRILDADIAQEAAQMLRHRIVQEAAAGVLAQANQTPALVLRLLTPA